MTKYLVALVIILSAAGLFMYSQQAEAPTLPAPQAQETTEGNPFGEGATPVGQLHAGEATTTDGAGAPTVPHEEATASGITRDELGKHKTQGDCWIAYKGTVYNITAWLPRHPGSAAAIAPYCGTAEEFAAAFNRQHGTGKDNRLKREGVDKGALTE